MLLVVDIGNSRIKAGIFDNDKIIRHSSFNEVTQLKLFISEYKISGSAICSVVPEKTKNVSDLIIAFTNNPPLIISIKEKNSNPVIKTNLIVDYKTPETLGIDRLCSAEGAFYLFKNSENFRTYTRGFYIISIDLGTATTINVIEYPGKFIGGLISPGIEMMFDSLDQRTAQLPHLDINSFTSIIGNDSNSSVASGVVTSVVGMIEKVINNLKSEQSAKEVFVYLTGGNAKKIIPFLKLDYLYEENLVLYGMNMLYKLNKI